MFLEVLIVPRAAAGWELTAMPMRGGGAFTRVVGRPNPR